jgi:soluble P-type ATPase
MNFNTKLEVISENFAQELATEQVVIIGAVAGNPINGTPTIKLRLCQAKNDKADVMLLGLKPRLRTMLQSVAVDKARALGIINDDGEVPDGTLLPADFNIQEIHEIYPAYANQEPRKYGLGVREGEFIVHNGQKTYSHVSLVLGKAHDFILAGDKTSTVTAEADIAAATAVGEKW